MRKSFMRIGILMALIAVVLGAMGSHLMEQYLEPEQLDTFKIGVRYQFYHSFAIIIVGILFHFGKKSRLTIAGWLFLAGIILFSGSLYLLSVQETLSLSLSWLGPITPIGGVLFIAGWIFLFLSTYQHGERKKKK
jgi:uncharacterized membrane protein YgdD (TMEM256/DUF423 family)